MLCGFSALSSAHSEFAPVKTVYAVEPKQTKATDAWTQKVNTQVDAYYVQHNKTLDAEHKKIAQELWDEFDKLSPGEQEFLRKWGAGNGPYDKLQSEYKKADYDKGVDNMTEEEKKTEKEMTEKESKAPSSDEWGWKAKTAQAIFDDMSITLFGIKIHFMDLTDTTRKLLLFNGSGVDDADNKGLLSLGNGNGVTLWSIAQQVNGGLASLSAFLLVAMFFMELFETTLREAERISWERVMMIFIKLYFWRTIASESFELVTAILNSGDWVFGVISKYAKVSTMEKFSIGKTVGTMIHAQGNIQATISLLFVFVFWTLILGSCFAVLTQVFTRAFKIIIYAAFAPLPIALCANEHTANTGKRFIMNFFAIALEAGIILLLTYIYSIGMSALQTDVMKNSSTWGAELGAMVNMFAGIIILNGIYAATISASTQLSREVIGI